MTHCPECQTPLVEAGVGEGQQVRCVKCSAQFRLGNKASTSADKLAWRSFWFGLASIMFSIFTAIPALYFGVRSLLRMRYVKMEKKDRVAAVAGTAMGGCGLIVGIFGLAIGAVIAFAFLTVEKSNNPQQIATQYNSIFENELPAPLVPKSSLEVFNAQFVFQYTDDLDRENQNLRLLLVHNKPFLQQTAGQTKVQLSEKNIDSRLDLKKLRTEDLEWNFAGETVNVKKIEHEIIDDRRVAAVESDKPGSNQSNSDQSNSDSTDSNQTDSAPDSNPPTEDTESKSRIGKTLVQYFGHVKNKQGITGFSINLIPPHDVFTEDRIRELVEDIKLR